MKRKCIWCGIPEGSRESFEEFNEWLEQPICCSPDGDGHLWIEKEETVKYCQDCKHLSVTEYKQSDKRIPHMCNKYGKRILHANHHPELPRLSECDEP